MDHRQMVFILCCFITIGWSYADPLANTEDVTRTCEPFWHQCLDGSCILPSFICDGLNDCQDGSDEETMEKRRMNERSSTIVPPTTTTSTTSHIQDQSGVKDEINCGVGLFRCVNNSTCIHETWKCDGDKDCSDGSDEENCEQKDEEPDQMLKKESKVDGNPTVLPLEPQSSTVLPIAYPQDRIGFPARSRFREIVWSDDPNCKPGFFQCAFPIDHSCIPQKWRCDGARDCVDGSDEENCDTKDEEAELKRTMEKRRANDFDYQMAEAEKKCKSEHPLLLWEVGCTGGKYCKCANSVLTCEEMELCRRVRTEYKICKDYEFKCNGDSKCLNSSLMCDGKVDCPNGDDEHDKCDHCVFSNTCSHVCLNTPDGPKCSCPEGMVLGSNEQTCEDGTELAQNIQESKADEHLIDLPFQTQSPTEGDKCSEGDFSCSGGKLCACFHSVLTCVQDEMCSTIDYSNMCKDGEFKCKEGTCLNSSLVCDGKLDCPNGDDEHDKCDRCAMSNNCSHVCLNTPEGPKCSCPEGMILGANEQTCEDGTELAQNIQVEEHSTKLPFVPNEKTGEDGTIHFAISGEIRLTLVSASESATNGHNLLTKALGLRLNKSSDELPSTTRAPHVDHVDHQVDSAEATWE